MATSAARPSSGIYALVLAVYFEGHFVTSESFFATKMPLRSSPLTDTSRFARNWSDSDPL